LRTAIRDEIYTYDLHANYGPYNLLEGSTIPAGSLIYASQYNNLQTMVNYVSGAGNLNAANPIQGSYWQDLKNRYDTLRQDCICNADCACNAVCSCHNDCACNYSDERLKENIILLGQRHGLNIYSFTYLWDKAKSYVGVMAQELLNTEYAHSVSVDDQGYYMVDYSKLPI
jgi:hypothetical protein